MSKKARRCHECGVGEVLPVAKKGRFARYKTMGRLEIPDDFPIPTCSNCGAEWIDGKTAEELDEALSRAFRAELRARVLKAILDIGKHAPQRKLERLLGLSQGYLSKLRSGDRIPSTELVSQLALISRDPKRRILELEEFWDFGG
jgi:hypothetical protein